MATRNGAAFSELFEQATDTFTGALKAGAKFQEDMTRWWTGAVGPAADPFQDWQKRSQALWTKAVPAAQKNVDEYLRLFDQSYRTSIDLMKKAMEAGRSGSLSETQAKSRQILEESMEAFRDNAKAMAEANLRAVQAWADLLRNGVDHATRAAHDAAGRAAQTTQQATDTARRATQAAAAQARRAARRASAHGQAHANA
ncbi:MAG: hypothetical protein JWL69_2624 [Phycisphaerales bacterium]|jgi:hypothetical protein|nr:hypothetical protein [Phycisphaerales bacterium]MDB5355271.1 hypothetical protein [Phycisphaerales bacterium]